VTLLAPKERVGLPFDGRAVVKETCKYPRLLVSIILIRRLDHPQHRPKQLPQSEE